VAEAVVARGWVRLGDVAGWDECDASGRVSSWICMVKLPWGSCRQGRTGTREATRFDNAPLSDELTQGFFE